MPAIWTRLMIRAMADSTVGDHSANKTYPVEKMVNLSKAEAKIRPRGLWMGVRKLS